jgi:hypothetical protein
LIGLRSAVVVAGHRRHPNWRLALTVLDSVLPGSTGFDPDDLEGLQQGTWLPFDADGLDEEVAARLWRLVDRPGDELLIVVTDACYGAGVGPFFVTGGMLDGLISGHAELFGDVFFSGDFVILAPGTGRVIVGHHEGLVGSVDGTPAPLIPKGQVSAGTAPNTSGPGRDEAGLR